jgi:diguanylate cyclase (GGDEF)-like protein
MAGRLIAALLGLACAAQSFAQTLPLTIDERIVACEAAEDAEPERAIALAQSVLDELPALTSTQKTGALGCRGWSLAMLGKREEARRDAYALVAVLQSLEPSAERVRLTRRAGGILHRGGDRVGAIELYARAVADAEAQGLEGERIPLLINLGVLHAEFEEHERARVNYEQALALMARLNDYRYEAPVRFNMGLTLNGQKKFADAIPHLQRTLELVRSTGMGGPMQEVAVSLALASSLQLTGDSAAAAELLARVRAMDVRLPDANMRLQRAQIEADQLTDAGDLQGALKLIDSIQGSELGDIQHWTWLRHRVTLLEKLGRFKEAAETLNEAVELREAYLRHQNHERLAALETHLRDREQRLEMERLESVATAQALQLSASLRHKWMIAIAAGLLLLMGLAVVAVQRRMHRRLDQVSRTDPLTSLANRRDMAERLSRRGASGEPVSAMFLFDIDLFKHINDEHGHGVGDEVLVAIAGRLRNCLPAECSVARWGGEEFLVLLDDADQIAAQRLIERVRQAMQAPIDTSIGTLRSSLSAGFCNLPLPGASGPRAWHFSMQLADSALYLAKRAQRGTWVGYWITSVLPDWPADRLGREATLARSLGVIVPLSEKPLAPPLAMAS